MRKEIEIEFHHYLHPQYEQLYPPIVPYASVIDLMFNMGDRSLEVIRSGRKNSLSASDVQQRYAEPSATPI